MRAITAVAAATSTISGEAGEALTQLYVLSGGLIRAYVINAVHVTLYLCMSARHTSPLCLPADEEVRLLRMQDVCAITGLARRTIYNLVKAGDLPPPVKIGPGNRVSAWRAQDVHAYVRSRTVDPLGRYGR